MPNRDGTGPGCQGKRQKRSVKGNYRGKRMPGCQLEGGKRGPDKAQDSSLLTMGGNARSIGMTLLGLAAALLPLAAAKIERLLGDNRVKTVPELESRPDAGNCAEPLAQIPEKSAEDNTNSAHVTIKL
ncbi:MAG: hypothetical protein HOE30_15560 [Deltaproteobacteria bacterium]|nr:hypothetical protein [Deltaproteobacteria bacterium]MBT4089901.1 hypothetical protein [Deltaproteobacteria bacterium]MBT4268496.1 hypothetical protein [Deltaproteobacteria bacterium]MBT7466166.1 hypothetical protein [Bacteroidota bacterium]